ncbi:NAD(P)-dependent oxidoreductase [Actibacterium mucosum]|uniref:NAD(P)-dependent oxidoreductase n=1 Tax=Actibacterium mucosum TaxID=1087332 RepID=UPI000B20F552|nr:NAD(P)-dependent oxidoreductase [Actibacterium mucosum]
MTDTSERIGFIGVGLMGHGMAKNIIDGGYGLTILGNRNRTPVDDLVSRGATEAKNPAEVGAASDIVFLCLPGSPQIEATIRGENGLRAGLQEGSVVVDCSTADPTSTTALAAELAQDGITLVDAPLSRTPKEAWEGTLDTMIGAPEAVLDRIRPVVDCWAGKIVHIGDVGDGHRMKLLNNFISLGYAAIYSEALALSEKVGISAERFHNVIGGGRMDCGFYQTFMECVVGGNREAHKFTLTNALKDLRYLESMADNAGLVNPLGNASKNSFAAAVAGGANGPEDYVPHLAGHVAKQNGL